MKKKLFIISLLFSFIFSKSSFGVGGFGIASYNSWPWSFLKDDLDYVVKNLDLKYTGAILRPIGNPSLELWACESFHINEKGVLQND